MNFSIFWVPDAEGELANIWIESPDRPAVTRAAGEIDRRLTEDPLNTGESREGNDRIVIQGPLVARVEVLEAERQVNV